MLALASARAARPRVAWRPLLLPLASAGVIAAGTVYIATHNPHIPGETYPCPLFAATGLLCPGCGGTRAVYDLAHGDVAGAFTMHPLLTLAAPLIAVVWLRWLLRGQGVALKSWPFPNWLGVAIPAVLVTFAVLRNIEPFAPYLGP